jgi:hypothetical protein
MVISYTRDNGGKTLACFTNVRGIKHRLPVGISKITKKLLSIKVFESSALDGFWGELWFEIFSHTEHKIMVTNSTVEGTLRNNVRTIG